MAQIFLGGRATPPWDGERMLQETPLARAFRATPTGLYLISTSRDGVPNVQFAFRALGINDDPPLLIIGQQTGNYSYDTVQQTGELVLNTCSDAHLHAVNASRGMSGREGGDKFAQLGLTPLPARHVKAPLVKDSYASVECRLVRELAQIEGMAILLVQALACYVDEEHPPIVRVNGKSIRLGDVVV